MFSVTPLLWQILQMQGTDGITTVPNLAIPLLLWVWCQMVFLLPDLLLSGKVTHFSVDILINFVS